jgi:plasmid stability protein
MIINIKDFPDDLHREVKIQAAVEGTTFKEITIRALREYLKKHKKGAIDHGKDRTG